MLSASVPHTAYLTPGTSVRDCTASTRTPRTLLDGSGATNCAAQFGMRGLEGMPGGFSPIPYSQPRATRQNCEEHLDEE